MDELSQKKEVENREHGKIEKILRHRFWFTMGVLILIFITALITLLFDVDLIVEAIVNSIGVIYYVMIFPLFLISSFDSQRIDFTPLALLYLIPYLLYFYLMIKMKVISKRTLFIMNGIIILSIIVLIPSCATFDIG